MIVQVRVYGALFGSVVGHAVPAGKPLQLIWSLLDSGFGEFTVALKVMSVLDPERAEDAVTVTDVAKRTFTEALVGP